MNQTSIYLLLAWVTIGSSTAGILTSEDVAGQQEATTWKYYSGDKFIVSDDILVATFKPGMYINRMRIIWVFLKTDMYRQDRQ